MGIPSAIIAYGVIALNHHKFLPWYRQDYGWDENEWWHKINRYEPPFEVYNKEGSYIGGIKPSESLIKEYYDHLSQWEKTHPKPFATKIAGSHDETRTIITSPSYPCYEVEWDSINFNLSDLLIEPDEAYEQFVAQYLPNLESPNWILAVKYF